MTAEIKWPGESRRYAQLQQNEVDREFVEGADVKLALRHVLPDKFLSRISPTGQGLDVLDVGSGIGRAVYHMHHEWPLARFWMLDGEGEKQHAGINHDLTSETFYSNHAEAWDWLEANGVDMSRVAMADNLEWMASLLGKHGSKIDLITSFRAVGFHWPMSPLLDQLAEVTGPGSMLMFESRPFSVQAYKTKARWQAARKLVLQDLDGVSNHQHWRLALFKHVMVHPHVRAYVLAERVEA